MAVSDARRRRRSRTRSTAAGVLAASERVMGNGVVAGVRDVVYVKPGTVRGRPTRGRSPTRSRSINLDLVERGVPYLLIGFGRWGSSDPWLGIPVAWSQIGGARAIVEATLPAMNVDLSQGSHFFHNISSFDVSYFSVPFDGDFPDRLGRPGAPAGRSPRPSFVRHVRLPTPAADRRGRPPGVRGDPVARGPTDGHESSQSSGQQHHRAAPGTREGAAHALQGPRADQPARRLDRRGVPRR